MSDLRNLLDREAERISAKPGAFDGVMRRAERRHRTRQVAAGVTAMAVVAGVALGAWSLLGNQPPGRGAPGDTPPAVTGWEGIWPHATRAEAEEAQAAVDGGDESLRWQLTFAEVGSRYLQQNHGWSVLIWGENDERDGPSRITVYAASCDLGDCKDPGPEGGAHQEVLLTLERLVRPGDGGVWTVTKVTGPSTALVGSRFGLGRIILVDPVDRGAGFECPAGPFVPPTEAQTRNAIETFLAASNGAAPDPRSVWDLLEPAVRDALGPYEIFAYHLRNFPAEPYGEWRIDAVDAADVYNTAPLEDACPGTGKYLSEAYVSFPGDPMQAMPAQFVFIGFPDGVKLWSVRS